MCEELIKATLQATSWGQLCSAFWIWNQDQGLGTVFFLPRFWFMFYQQKCSVSGFLVPFPFEKTAEHPSHRPPATELLACETWEVPTLHPNFGNMRFESLDFVLVGAMSQKCGPDNLFKIVVEIICILQGFFTTLSFLSFVPEQPTQDSF